MSSELPFNIAGISGPKDLQDILTNSTHPQQTVAEFQSNNGVSLPSLKSMLPLLDLHNIPLLEFHSSLFEQLKENLITHVNTITTKGGKQNEIKLKQLLQNTFPYRKVKSMFPVVNCILRNMRHIDYEYLEVINLDKDLYEAVDVNVKRQIWITNQCLFGNEVYPLILEYIKEKDEALFSYEDVDQAGEYFSSTPKVRRQSSVVKRLAGLIGDYIKLYDFFLQFLRTLFLRTQNYHYCSLRTDILMTVHDADIEGIIAIDPCHTFTWCLDACLKDGNIDDSKIMLMRDYLEDVQQKQKEELIDVSMTLRDPHVMHFLGRSILTKLKECIDKENVPKDDVALIFFFRLLILGLESLKIIQTQISTEPLLDSNLITKFLPALISLMVDDQVRHINSHLLPNEHDAAIAVIEHSGLIPEQIDAYIKESSAASVVTIYYILDAVKAKNLTALLRILGSIANCPDKLAFEDTFLSPFVFHLIDMKESFQTEDFCTALFDEFLFVGIMFNNVPKHVFKLVWHIHPYLSSKRLNAVIKILQDCNSANSYDLHKLFTKINLEQKQLE